jgi:hypothetical protein
MGNFVAGGVLDASDAVARVADVYKATNFGFIHDTLGAVTGVFLEVLPEVVHDTVKHPNDIVTGRPQ